LETAAFVLIQLLNGVQYGLLLFLLSTGLTLIFGVMGIINLAHGSFFMLGAYLALAFTGMGLGFLAVMLLSLLVASAIGLATERLALRPIYGQGHLEQVLLTFGLILIFNELVRIIWGAEIQSLPIPELLRGHIPLFGEHRYPLYRLFVTAFGLILGGLIWLLIYRTRLGMIIRAGAVDRKMVDALGIHIDGLFAAVFALGVGLAALSGIVAAPILSLYPGMGEEIIILTFVVVVVGGLGSLQGALLASLLIGVGDTFGKALVPELSAVMVYVLMSAVLLLRPRGLFSRG
jgi:branched-chain amino acid transport system permease protein